MLLPQVWLCSPLGPRKTPYIYARVRMSPATYPSTPFSIPPVKPCRRRRHFSPQTRMNRFVFLNLPILSLGNHLGVTVSPQSPLPAGYVTLPVDSRSPPLGLMLPHSRKQARQIPPFSMHSKHMPPRFLGARRTVGDVGEPDLARRGGDEVALEQVRGVREVVTTICRAHHRGRAMMVLMLSRRINRSMRPRPAPRP